MDTSPSHLNHPQLATELLRTHPALQTKITTNCHLPPHLVLAALTEVLRFLNLIAFTNATLTPSKTVDDTWHEFILFTKSYAAFCERHFDRMIHHSPGGTEENNRMQFERTLTLYKEHYGEPDPTFWGTQEPPECGACESGPGAT